MLNGNVDADPRARESRLFAKAFLVVLQRSFAKSRCRRTNLVRARGRDLFCPDGGIPSR